MKTNFTFKPLQHFLFMVFLLINGQALLAVTYYSKAGTAPNTLANWNSDRNGTSGSTPGNFTSGDIFVIQGTTNAPGGIAHSLTTGAAWSISGTGSRLWIEGGATLKATFQITLNAATTFQIDANGTYIHANATAGPQTTTFAGTESFDTNSTVEFQSLITTAGTLRACYLACTGAFPGTVIWNIIAGSTAYVINDTATTVTTIPSNFIVRQTGAANGGSLAANGNRANTHVNFTGNLTLEAGKFYIAVSNNIQNTTLSVTNFTINNGATFDCSIGTGQLVTTLNIRGDLTNSGTGVFRSSNDIVYVNFTGTSTQIYNNSSTGFNRSNFRRWTIAANATVQLASDLYSDAGSIFSDFPAITVNGTLIFGTGSSDGSTNFRVYLNSLSNTGDLFTLGATGTLKITSTNGINASGATTGNIITYGNNKLALNAGAKYEYNGTAGQVTGTALPASLTGTLTINNSAGVTLSQPTTMSTATGLVVLTNGFLTTTATNLLTTTNTAVGAITTSNSAYINGPLQWTLTNTSGTYTFPVGKGGTYLPFTINSYASATTQAPTVEAFNSGSGGSYAAGNVSTSEYWKVNYSANAISNPIVRLQRNAVIYSVGLVGGAASAGGSYTSYGGNVSGEGPYAVLATNADAIAGSGVTRFYAIINFPFTISVTNGNWNNASTWSTNAIPTVNDNVYIEANHTVTVPTGTTATCAKLTKTAGSTGELNVIGDLAVADNIEVPSHTTTGSLLTISGTGTIAVTGSIRLGSEVDKQTDTDTDLNISGALSDITTSDVSIYSNRKTTDTEIFEENIFTVSAAKFTVNNQILITTELSPAVGTFTNLGTPGGRIVLKGATPFAVSGAGTSGFNLTGGGDFDEANPEATGYVSFNRGSSQTLRTLSITNAFFNNAASSGTITINKLCKLNSGTVSSTIALSDGAIMDRSGGSLSSVLIYPSGNGKYLLKYSQNGSSITAGQEFRTFEPNRISKIILATTNGVNLNAKTYTVPEVVATSSTSLTNGRLTVTDILDAQTSGTVNTGGCITLKSDATNTARIPNLTQNPTITGNVTVERYIQNLDNENNSNNRTWQLLTAPLKGSSTNTVFENWQENGTRDENAQYGVEIWGPVDNQANNGLKFITNSSYNLRSYQNVSGVWKFVNVENTKTEPLFTSTINKGFLLFATAPYDWEGMIQPDNLPDYSKRELTLRATGNLITGNVVYNSVPSVGNGYALIGNPYASPINIESILDDSDNSTLSRKIWVIDPSIGNFGAYNIWNDGVWSNLTGGYNNSRVELQSGQAFFVQASTGTGSLTIKESHKGTDVNSADIFNRTAKAKDDLVRINLYAEDAASSTWKNRDACVARFYNGANNLIDTKDVQKFANPSENISFVYGSANYTVDHRAPIVNGDILNLRISSTVANASYKLRIYTEDFVNYNGTAYLEDLFTNTKTTVALDGSVVDYPFTVTTAPTSTGNRFRIVFAEKVLGVNKVDENRGVTVFPNPTNGEGVSVNLGILSNTNYNYRLVNVLGQTIQEGTFIKENDNQDLYITFNKKMTKGWYALEISDANNKAITKPIIIE